MFCRASDRCKQEKRKTITGEDLLWAMQNLGFDNYIEVLSLFTQKYRDHLKGDKIEKKRKKQRSPTDESQQQAYNF